MNPLARVIVGGSLVGFLLLLGGFLFDNGMGWFPAHGMVLMVAVVLPALEWWHGHAYARFRTPAPLALVQQQAAAFVLSATLLGAGFLLQPSGVFSIVAFLGMLALLAAGVWSYRIMKACAPRRKESMVDVAADPLTKGDDACWTHVRLGHLFFPIGTVFLVLALAPYVGPVWQHRLWLAGAHILLLGYLLPSVYATGHLWVPRFSGVPAIAAGAIKGELHSTLPALILMPLGFLTDMVGFTIAGGAMAFLGFFTYMGVLGANIMRYKSVTHRVTPEFVYIPWTFTGIFWLVSGVLMGIFLNVVPDVLADQAGSLRFIHVHINLVGGVVQLLLGWLTRTLPERLGRQPPAFAGAMKGSFYLFNLALAFALFGHLAQGPMSLWVLGGAVLLAASLALFLRSMGAFIRGPAAAGA